MTDMKKLTYSFASKDLIDFEMVLVDWRPRSIELTLDLFILYLIAVLLILYRIDLTNIYCVVTLVLYSLS